jgi:hypothetical protein
MALGPVLREASSPRNGVPCGPDFEIREGATLAPPQARYAGRKLTPESVYWHAKHAKTRAKTRSKPRFDVLMRNSLFTRALIREILVSRAPLMRAILINLSQKIAKPQANIPGVFGSSPANVRPLFGSRKTNITPDSAALNGAPNPARKKCNFFASSSASPRSRASFVRLRVMKLLAATALARPLGLSNQLRGD